MRVLNKSTCALRGKKAVCHFPVERSVMPERKREWLLSPISPHGQSRELEDFAPNETERSQQKTILVITAESDVDVLR